MIVVLQKKKKGKNKPDLSINIIIVLQKTEETSEI